MLNAINTFKNDESGAVTVDWVVLTAALVGLGLAVMGVVSQDIGHASGDVATQLSADHIPGSTTGFSNGNTSTIQLP